MRIHIPIATFILSLSTVIFAQQQSEEQKKLNFLVGGWKSVSVNQSTGEESVGESSVRWIMSGTWLEWKFTSTRKQKPFEVITLINYQNEKKQYAFYSFNPFDEEPIPHFGNWLDKSTLRIQTDFQGVEVHVEFQIKENGDFVQEHFRINPSGERVITSKTKYSRIKQFKMV